jgi:hypothetical protein
MLDYDDRKDFDFAGEAEEKWAKKCRKRGWYCRNCKKTMPIDYDYLVDPMICYHCLAAERRMYEE